MNRNGQSIPVLIEKQISSEGFLKAPETGVMWVADNMPTTHQQNWPTPSSDETIEVQVKNVLINGQLHDFTYYVTIFDAANVGLAEAPSHDAGPETFIRNAPMVFMPASRSWSERVQGRSIETSSFSKTFDAEESTILLIEHTDDEYEPIASGRAGASGKVYHLVHSFPKATIQFLELPSEYLINGLSPSLDFDSSLAWSSERQIASVDINFGDGYRWQSIWSAPAELIDYHVNTFSDISIDLSQWIGRTARIRFRYDPDPSGSESFYLTTSTFTGWAIDNIELTGVEEVISSSLIPSEAGQDFFIIESDSESEMLIQSREFAFGGFALDWGPVSAINPVAFGDDILPALNEWNLHPVLGNLYRANQEWSYSPDLGWLYTEGGIWLWDGSDWMRYIMGDIAEGIWFYSPTQGFYFTGN
jgi:hypothetical protein